MQTHHHIIRFLAVIATFLVLGPRDASAHDVNRDGGFYLGG